MIPLCRSGLILFKASSSPAPGQVIVGRASYTSKSNGSAFLNSLDFLSPASSQPRNAAVRPSATAFQSELGGSFRPSKPELSSKREHRKTSPPPSAKGAAGSILEGLELPLFGSNTPNKQYPRQSEGSKFLNQILTDTVNSNNRPTGAGLSLGRGSITSRPPSRNIKEQQSRPILDRPRRDEEIESQWIQFVTEDGQLGGQKTLSSVLRTMDRGQFFLVEVDPNAQPPICKLFSKKELFDKAKAAKQAKKANTVTTKELQLNWGTDAHDLSHKLAKCRAFLEKGYRLEIQVNGKKGRHTTPDEREVVMQRLKDEFEPVAKYVKNPDWIQATTVIMTLQGIATTTEKANKKKKGLQQEQEA
ncbi:hypothetical protein BGZ83_007910 [Gryganskiella cystojenkinii]|nr:hypothetical protein BGZ83_007910 [Gryganskiella cystojenkinii]